MKLILASASPRRKEILQKNGFNFEIIKSNCEEKNTFSAEETAKANALLKAKDVFDNLVDKNAVVLGADTVVVHEGKILGKPKNKEDICEAFLSPVNKFFTTIAQVSRFFNGLTKSLC